MIQRAIITSASSKFFPSLANLIASIKANYPNHPPIFVYDLGLYWTYKKELSQIKDLEVLAMPPFCSFWRKCYTWKTYIFSHPLAHLNLYLDAGSQVLRSLDGVFGEIDRDGYFAVEQDVELERIVPSDYKQIFRVKPEFYKKKCLTAGVFGFKDESSIATILGRLYQHALKGLALGFSPKDTWKNTGVNKTDYIRDCEIFRHDTTLLSLLMRQEIGEYVSHPSAKYAAAYSKEEDPKEVIWNLRLNFIFLEYLNCNYSRSFFWFAINRLIANSFIFLRIGNMLLKGNLWKIKNLSKSAR